MSLPRLLLCAICCVPLSGWGPNGHRVVGRIADRHLSKKATVEVRALLGQDTLAEVGTWADDIRSDSSWSKAAAWHWVTVEDNDTYATSKKNPEGDVIEAIQRFTKILRDKTAPR